MPGAQGINVKVMVGKESTYGTAVAVSSIIPFVSEDINKLITYLQAVYMDGKSSLANTENSIIQVSGSLNAQGVYDTDEGAIKGIGDLILATLGSRTVVDPTGTPGDEVAQYVPTEDLEIYHTTAINKQTSVWEIPGMMVNQMQITGQAGGNINFAFTLVGRDIVRTGDGGTIVNTSGAMDAIESTEEPQIMTFDQAIFRNAALGSAMDATDQVCINSFNLTYNNNLTPPEHSTPCASQTRADAKLPLKFVRNGRREVTLQVNHLRYESDQEFTWHKNGTLNQADLKFLIGSNEFNIWLPKCKVIECTAPVPGMTAIQKNVTYQALRNAGTNTDVSMADSNSIDEEIAIETKNLRTNTSN